MLKRAEVRLTTELRMSDHDTAPRLPVRTPLDSGFNIVPEADSVGLCEAEIHLIAGSEVIQGSGRAMLQLEPKLTLMVRAEFLQSPETAFAAFDGPDQVEFKFGDGFQSTKAIATSLTLSADESSATALAELVPNPQRMRRGQPNELIKRLVFHVANFPNFLGGESSSADFIYCTAAGGMKRLGNVILADPPWSIQLQAMVGTAKTIERLNSGGGYGITHVAELTRSDGSTFAADEAEDVLHKLYLFVSFARGAWAPVVLNAGFDTADNRVYENWGVQIGTPWESCRGWFDRNRGQALGAVYPGFCALLRDPMIGQAVSRTLYWYLRSNRGGDGPGIDSGIILSQAALELLASAYLESQKIKMPSRSRAADQLREALRQLGIPVAIPDALAGLKEGQRQSCWQDAPEAITRIRNELVHPKRKLPIKMGAVVPNAWSLAQWYIELLILRLSGYSGQYSNRLEASWVGEVEDVPWK